MPTYVWYSPSTDVYQEVLTSIALRNVAPDEAPYDWERILETPSFKRHTFLDGQRKDLVDFKASAKLQQAAAELPHNDSRRNEIQKELIGRKRANKKG